MKVLRSMKNPKALKILLICRFSWSVHHLNSYSTTTILSSAPFVIFPSDPEQTCRTYKRNQEFPTVLRAIDTNSPHPVPIHNMNITACHPSVSHNTLKSLVLTETGVTPLYVWATRLMTTCHFYHFTKTPYVCCNIACL